MFKALEISATGLVAQRTRLDTIANNIANAGTTRDAEGKNNPYRRKAVVFEAPRTNPFGGNLLRGVQTPKVFADPTPFRLAHEPGHPDADPASGIVKYPNVNMIEEMVNMIDATRAYEANVTAMDASKGMFAASLRILA